MDLIADLDSVTLIEPISPFELKDWLEWVSPPSPLEDAMIQARDFLTAFPKPRQTHLTDAEIEGAVHSMRIAPYAPVRVVPDGLFGMSVIITAGPRVSIEAAIEAKIRQDLETMMRRQHGRFLGATMEVVSEPPSPPCPLAFPRIEHAGGRFIAPDGTRFDYVFPELMKDPGLPAEIYCPMGGVGDLFIGRHSEVLPSIQQWEDFL